MNAIQELSQRMIDLSSMELRMDFTGDSEQIFSYIRFPDVSNLRIRSSEEEKQPVRMSGKSTEASTEDALFGRKRRKESGEIVPDR